MKKVKSDVLLKDKHSNSVVYLEEIKSHGTVGYCVTFGIMNKGECFKDEENTELFRKMTNGLTFGRKPSASYLLARFPQLKANGYELS